MLLVEGATWVKVDSRNLNCDKQAAGFFIPVTGGNILNHRVNHEIQFFNFIAKRFSRCLATVAAALTALSFTACTKHGKDVEIELAGGEKLKLSIAETLRVNLQTEPPTLDWSKSSDTTSSSVIDNIMDGLVEYDLNDKELGLKPALALKWEPSEQAKKWKFTLRGDVVWNDGKPFEASHVVDGWKRLLQKETASPYAYYLFAIKNAKAFNEGKVPWEQVGVKATTATELNVELEKPMGYFPSLLTHASTFPIRLDAVQKGGDRWTEPKNIITLGAYNLKGWQHDKMIVLERNEKYYGEKALTKYVAGYMIIEQATAINLFDSGKLDVVTNLPSVELKKLRTRKEFNQQGLLTLYYYGINNKKPPMDNVKVRKAIAMAIDRQEIVQLLGGGQMPLSSWVPPGMFGYEPSIGMTFNVEKAKALLKEAGYSDVSKFPKMELKFNTNEDHQRIAENVQAQLKRNLGINVELKNEEWKVYLNTLTTDPPHLYRFGWLADYPDPDNFLSIVTGYSDNNHLNWKNPKFDALIEKGSSLTDKEERRKVYAEAQRILLEEDCAAIPLYSQVVHTLVSPRVHNYPFNAMEIKAFRGVQIK